MKVRDTYLFVGGPANGAEATFAGEPQTKTVEREAYVLTYLGNTVFYRHHTMGVAEGQQAYLRVGETELSTCGR